MHRILAGIDTEYGLRIEGRGAETQVEDSEDFVRSYPGPCFVGWDYRFENPRNDLRGFSVDRLAIDPNDAKFDKGKSYGDPKDVRADRVLPNGARFYNDHGHPEYATPESFSVLELARFVSDGDYHLLDTARVYASKIGRKVTLYRNNTDFHGSSFGTHESYLVSRKHSPEAIQKAVVPILIARQLLTGAGKVGAETDEPCDFQLSQRADHLSELCNLETLWRRPIFNTRDEPHADPAKWIRLHVITGDSNMMEVSTALKVGLVKMALYLLENGKVPVWKIDDPVDQFKHFSRNPDDASARNSAREIIESYLSAASEAELKSIDPEMDWVAKNTTELLTGLESSHPAVARRIEWFAKRSLLQQVKEEFGDDADLRSYDLEFHNIDLDEGLYHALEQADQVEPAIPSTKLGNLLRSRAFARSLAVTKFKGHIQTVGWRGITINNEFIDLPPEKEYPATLADCPDVESFIVALREIR
ncbi:MAG: proteasome accessory factor PafA2 family protein [Fimbriimonas sp.]|nr:proteasome accessory factor PafA2 family protein [Fimbriimonas sp.]